MASGEGKPTTTALNKLRPPVPVTPVRRTPGPRKPQPMTSAGINGHPARRWQRPDGR